MIVTLTQKGEDPLTAAMPHQDRLVRELIVDVLSAEQLKQLRTIAAALETQLHPDPVAPVDRRRLMSTINR
ncbi:MULTISPECIES: hypothetical protein [unclassified Curtobacterium]|uniref:hypothetical protein n=1 Tax=unclassified Curtobacterium TaxID=257496 RepID=UPI0011B7592A|nr:MULTISPECIES: hypothetical protein [unclassified Curtobacterium]